MLHLKRKIIRKSRTNADKKENRNGTNRRKQTNTGAVDEYEKLRARAVKYGNMTHAPE